MSQRESGYERKERDLYETPEWVTEALHNHLPRFQQFPSLIWEPAAASGKMVKVMQTWGHLVDFSDIEGCVNKVDFFECFSTRANAIITNPPYNQAVDFLEHALRLMQQNRGLVALLLRTDFDHAASRRAFFESSAFAKKVVLTKRIVWFENSKGSPSFNHAWFIWDWRHRGPPTIAYGPEMIDQPISEWDAMWSKPFSHPEMT